VLLCNAHVEDALREALLKAVQACGAAGAGRTKGLREALAAGEVNCCSIFIKSFQFVTTAAAKLCMLLIRTSCKHCSVASKAWCSHTIPTGCFHCRWPQAMICSLRISASCYCCVDSHDRAAADFIAYPT
jgi:hypothetical protein